MNRKLRKHCLYIFAACAFFAQDSFAFPKIGKTSGQSSSLPTVLKADEVTGDKIENVFVATGNVEARKDNSVIFADKMTYNKNSATIKAIGNVRAKDLEVGNIRGTNAEIKDDFSEGKFFNSRLIFNDGSYLTSPEIDRESKSVTVLQKSIYSTCPNPEIEQDNEMAGKKRDFVSIKSSKTTIDRGEGLIKVKHAIIRIYNMPVLYTPYMKIALSNNKRQSGFLTPSYTKNRNLGFGVQIPYYFDIAPNIDLTTTPYIILTSNQWLLKNQLRHMTSYGEYFANLEIANNKITSANDTLVINRTKKEYRWQADGRGLFDFTKNTGLDFDINSVSDRNYFRDYHLLYTNYTMSKVNLDYVNGRDYHAIKTIRIQELENPITEKSAPLILPSIDSHIETKPLSFKEKFALTSNTTLIQRESGLQYRRATFIPEVNIPFNLQGNLFNINSKLQGDFYSLENNFKYSDRTNNYSSTELNSKPEASLSWKLPLINKGKSNTFMIEPMANFVVSTYTRTHNSVPNEDSNDSELTVNNLFTSDRIYGFDRNETGKRMNYGVKSSLFNKYGEFGVTVGQGYQKSQQTQDVKIRGFNANNKSDLVGQMMYKATKYFNIIYSFQLNESNYRNEVNEINASLTLDRFTISTNYLLLRKNLQNPDKRDQITLSSSVKISQRWRADLSATKNLVTGRVITRSLGVYRDGCCTVFGFTAVERNNENLIKAQQNFSVNVTFKNL